MKLISAHIKNFRLLTDLELNFSIDIERPLTVIRAANETGKTTSETALIWGLYGSGVLHGKGKRYPLYPSDSLAKGERKVEISVEIEFETEGVVPIGKGRQQIKNVRYRLLRHCIEYPSTSEDVKREHENITLYEVTENGTERILDSNVRGIIENSIPEALKDIYFTDGDSAMSFIEAAATQGAKRKRVQDAIEALLGLRVLEQTVKHLDGATRRFHSKIDNRDYANEFEKINDRIGGAEEDVKEWNEELNSTVSELTSGTKKLREVEKKIEGILKLGNKEKLVSEIQKIKNNIGREQGSAERALNDLSSLMRNPDIASSMIMTVANKGLAILNELSESRQLPKVNIPILEELLDRTNCFCGADLSNHSSDGEVRRNLIKESIDNSRSSDALQEAATSLFYSVRSESFDVSVRGKWVENYSSLCANYEERVVSVENLLNELKEKELEKDKINDEQLQEFRSQEKSLKNKLNKARIDVGGLETKIQSANDRLSDLKIEQKKVESKLNKNDTSTDKLKLTRLTKTVFENIFDFLRKNEVQHVSQEMNRIFLDMIGADPETNNLATITKAELTEDFDILVFGSNGHKLNPDQDLNGASRRAITLAFILALTKVSEVKAPNVIDTPLGMMSGYVKQSVLNKTLEEGSQIILFLTHDEIQGVENILDKKAGKIFTLTNPAHGRMLLNEPKAKNIGVIRCECNHRQSCETCARKNIDESGKIE